MKNKMMTALLLISPMISANWSIGTKADFSRSTNDNVDATKTGTKKDSFNVLNAYVQTKNESNRIRLRGKFTKYAQYTENDSNYFDLSYQYKFQKNKEFTLTYFNEKYTGTPTSSTDVTGDNNGGKFNLYLADQFNKETLGYFNFTVTTKKYTNETRTDNKPELSTGLEFQAGKDVIIIPELSFGFNKSSQDYYTVTTWGPSLTAIVTLTDKVELTTGYSVTKSNYKNREFTKTVGSKTQTLKEEQTLSELEAGLTVTVFDTLDLTGKYTISKNTSNNNAASTTKEYEAKEFKFGFALRF